MAFSPDGKKVLIGAGMTPRLWDAQTGEVLCVFTSHLGGVRSVAFSPDGKQVLTGGNDGTPRLSDAQTGKQLSVFTSHLGGVKVAFSPDGKQILTGGYDGTARLWDLHSHKQLQVLREKPFSCVAFSPDGKQVLTGSWYKTARLWDVKSGDPLLDFGTPEQGNRVSSVAFSPDGKQVLTGSTDRTARLWDTRYGKEVRAFTGHASDVHSVAFSPDSKFILTGSHDATTRLWDSLTGRELCRFVGFKDGTWATFTPDNYYLASSGAINGVAFAVGNRVFSFEQFDLKFNRPDKVLERIGLASPELIAASRHAYQKRLKRMNFTEEMLSDDFHIPAISVTSEAKFITRERTVKLKISAEDSKYLLDRLNIDVNGVPVQGTSGISLRKKASKSWQQEVEVELSAGRNKIDLSVLNAKGAESLKETLSINYDAPPAKPNLYVVVVGVSDYEDARFRLTYADKDARDLADLFESKKDRFGEVTIQRILNRDATRENILKAKDFLKGSRVDDMVVLFFAGHGLLDSKLDYYFGTADIDFKNPGKRGLPYDAIEDLLDGIRARKKLLLMDTCHSGELDKEDVKVVHAEKKLDDEVKVRTFRGLDFEISSKVGLGNSYQLLQGMFADLRRGTGAVVISSAGGAEFALESAAWKNGVFTHALIRGLKGEADRNRDGQVQVSELRDFVEQEVRRLTNGRQVPTARRENLADDFSLVNCAIKPKGQVLLTFVNETGDEASIYWLKAGQPIFNRKLANGGTFREITYTGHRWRAVVAGRGNSLEFEMPATETTWRLK